MKLNLRVLLPHRWAGLYVRDITQWRQRKKNVAPNGKGIGAINHRNNSHASPNGNYSKLGKTRCGNGISYHGGPVMTSGVTMCTSGMAINR